jgi:fructose-1,6-bisphosphatase/inositol monophosphatase family enzyme
MFWAVRGGGAYRNDERIGISNITSASQAVASLNGINNYSKQAFGPRFLDWASQFWAVRSMGGAYDAMLLASGHLELWIEPQPQAWDLVALQVILEESGARMVNFDGGRSIYGGNAVGYVPALQPVVRDLLRL